MSGFLINLVLALAWVMVTGSFSFVNILAGFLIGYGVLAITSKVTGKPGYTRKLIQTLSLVSFFGFELVLANLRVTVDLLMPTR